MRECFFRTVFLGLAAIRQGCVCRIVIKVVAAFAVCLVRVHMQQLRFD
jgi:hypothetical protein